MMEFLHRSLVLIALVCLVACLPQAPANCLLNVPSKDKLDGIPKVNTDEVKADPAVPEIKDVPGKENLNGIPKVNTVEVKTDLGVPAIKDVPGKENLDGIPKVNTVEVKTDLGVPAIKGKENLDGIPKVNTEEVKRDLGIPGIKGKENLDGIPKVNTEEVKRDLGIPGIKGKKNLDGIPKVNTVEVKTDLGVPAIKDVPGKENLDGIPKVNTEEVKRDLGIPGIKGILRTIGIGGGPSLPKAGKNVQGLVEKKSLLPSLKKTGAPAIPCTSTLVELCQRVNKMESALKLLEFIQVVGDKMIVSSGKIEEIEKSRAACQKIGGRMAIPKNEAENNGLSFFTKKHNQYAYVGLKEGPKPGVFLDPKGIPALYTSWSKKEPSGQGQENCVEMYTDGKWNDKGCNQRRLTVCEL
ncbi:pulmonary surfactant-associated protein A2-like isoform X3 [Rana temporaria]|uniref:pulmonary surfactant-associated protein A2-like isoform X3 n=1 Tax=Rana temporaria TaxID=8407 RepID=UPI001AACA527|nr:pulmonary surfactant-associated protein A2-like isoform X3 [Rana temporaria]